MSLPAKRIGEGVLMARITRTIGPRLVWTAMAGALLVIAGLLWVDGPPSTFAQTDTTAPTISSIAITSDPNENDADLGAYNLGGPGRVSASTNWASGVYRIGDEVQVTVTFSENVTVTGSPQLELATDPRNRTAAYESAEGSGVVFSYTVAQGDWDNNGIAISANKLTLNGGSIKDAANNDAYLSHNALAAQDGHKVDGVRPTLSRLYFVGNSDGSNGAYTTGGELIIIAEFTERNGPIRGSVSGPPQVKLDLGGEEKAASWDYSLRFNDRRTNVAYFSYVVQEGNLDSDGPAISTDSVELNGGFIRDAAGNDAVLTHSAVTSGTDFIVDAVAPTVSSIAITSDPGDDDTYGTGDKIEVTVTFSENMSLPKTISCSSDVVHCKAELELNIGGTASTADYQSHDSAEVVYAYTVQAGDNDDNGIAIGANRLTGQRIMDAAGKNGEGINDADLSHDAVADDSEHKVFTSGPTKSTDATLSALALSNIDFGTFDSETLQYTAQVFSGITQTHVTATRNHPKATYLVKLGGVTDEDGTIDLSAGSTVITVEVTAEDGQTMRTYSVTVTRPVSNNAHLIDLTLSGISLEHGSIFYPPGFSGLVFNYTPSVAHSLAETTVTPRAHQSFATYVIKLDGVTDADGVIALSVGSNVITIEVTAEDGVTTKTYTITVTRAAAPLTDATLKRLALSGIDIGGGVGEGADAHSQTSFRASVYHSVSQTTVTPTVNHSGASYVIKLGGVEDADGTISLAVGSNVITVEVTAEDDSTTKTYTVTVNRATASAPTTGELSTDDPPVNFRATDVFSDHTIIVLSFPRNRGITGWVLQRYEHDGDEFVSSGSDMRSEVTGSKDLGGEGLRVGNSEVEPGALYKWVAQLTNSQSSTVIETSLTVRIPPDETTEPSTDATLSGLTLSGVDFGTFASGTTSYTASVANSVSQTTVSPTVNHSGASYVIKLDGVEDADGDVSLSVGSNVITVEVTAEDGEATQTYTVTITRAAPPSTDATLNALSLSGVDFGTFDSTTTSYTVQVANSVSQTTVTPTVSHSGASYVIKLDGATDADGVISLSVGSNVITVEVTAEDDSTSRTYIVTITRAAPPSTDATLSALTLGGIDFGTFASGTTSYSAQVANSVSQTTVTPTVNDSGASYIIKLGGVADVDGVVSLSVGSNVITVEVTAEDNSTTRTYTITVTRTESSNPGRQSSDAKLSALTLSGIDFGTFDSTTTSYSARVENSVSETTVTPTLNHSGASHVIKLGGVTDVDGVISLSVGSNVIAIEVTAEDGNSTQTYTVTVTRAAPPSTDATLSALSLSDIDFGTFAPGTTSYTAEVANSVSQTTVSPTVNHSGASYVIKLDGASDADGVVALGVGSNVITVEVTAQDGQATRTYTVTVTRAAEPSSDATLSSLTLSGIDFGTFDPTTTSYRARVASETTETTVTPTVNHSSASYVIKLGEVTDDDGVISLTDGSNVITVEVTAEDGETTQTYTVTVHRGAGPCVSEGAISDSTNTGLVSDCDALLAVKDTLAGTASLNWSADTSITSWEGLMLRGTPERVAGLNLSYKSLDGEIPAELGDLSMLTKLNLRSNDLSGSIPGSLGRLSRLTLLNLHSNNLSGDIPDLSTTMLEELYLANNYDEMVAGSGLTGPVPTWLNGMNGMRELWLWGNRLSGTIPDLSGMTSLQKLKLGKNDLRGGVPQASQLPPNMTWLVIDRNPLGGTIPDLSSLTSLRLLWLHSNDLTGSIPSGDMLPPNVDDLNLRDNLLTGPIPDLSGLDMATRVRLHNNSLSGEVPGTLGDLDRLRQLWLDGNRLTSIAAELGDLSDTLIEIALSRNSWTEAACVPAALANVATNDYADAGLQICESNDGS